LKLLCSLTRVRRSLCEGGLSFGVKASKSCRYSIDDVPFSFVRKKEKDFFMQQSKSAINTCLLTVGYSIIVPIFTP